MPPAEADREMSLNKTLRWLIAGFGLCFAVAAAAAAWHQVSKPATLVLAVGPAELDDAALAAAFSRALTESKALVRLSVVQTSGPVEALDALAKKRVQLAVIRGDAPASDRVRAVAVLHTDPVVIVAPHAAKVAGFGDLKGKVLGVIGPPGANDPLLATIRRHYHASGEVRALPPSAAEVSAAVRARTVDALLFVVPTTRGINVGESWATIRRASRRKLTLVAIDDAEAIAAAAPAYEAGEIAAGQFGGSPALPKESVDTLLVPTYLVADKAIPNDAVTNLTRSLFDDRQRLAADAPIARLIKPASTDKDATFPVHPGAKAYYDGEETTFMDRYGDWLFFGPMLLGALGSVVAALLRFVRPDEAPQALGSPLRIGEVITAIRQAGTLAELDLVRSEIDTYVEGVVTQGASGGMNEQVTGTVALALSYIERAMAERRDLLLRSSTVSKVGSGAVRAL
jgi:TRAP transporter TAXI family solute receptor